MAGERVGLVFTDPPYNLASEGPLIGASIRDAYDKLKESAWDKDFSFLDVAGSLEAAMAPDVTVYVTTSHYLVGQILDWMKETGDYSGLCVWEKPNPMPSLSKRHWTLATELICYMTRGKHVFNFPSQGHASSVWHFAKTRSNDLHPTMKPVELVEHAVVHSSRPGGQVLDLFLGSGSTLIACEKTARRCFGMEIDPKYCDVVLSRWEAFTGQKAVRESTEESTEG
jgi:DNA modification methylase